MPSTSPSRGSARTRSDRDRSGDPRQPSPASQAPAGSHRLVAGRLGQRGVERHRLVPELAGVLVDRGEQRRGLGQPHVGLVERDLGGVDRLGAATPRLTISAPVRRVGATCTPRAPAPARVPRYAVDVPLDPAAGDREAELLAARSRVRRSKPALRLIDDRSSGACGLVGGVKRPRRQWLGPEAWSTLVFGVVVGQQDACSRRPASSSPSSLSMKRAMSGWA